MKTLFFAIVVATLLFAGYSIGEATNKKQSSPLPTPFVQKEIDKVKLWEIVQEWRLENGKAKYIENSQLCDYANLRVNQLERDNSHNLFLKEVRNYFPTEDVAENLANGFHNEKRLLNSWLNSPSHRANLEKDYTYSCIATDGNYVVHLFLNL